MQIIKTKFCIQPASIIDRLFAPLVYTWTGLRILMWGEGYINIPMLDFDSEEEMQQFYDKLNEKEDDEGSGSV